MSKPVSLPPSASVVQTLRKARGWSQQALAERAGVQRVEILAVEKGRNKATSARMRDGLARAFELDPEKLSLVLSGEVAIDALSPPLVG